VPPGLFPIGHRLWFGRAGFPSGFDVPGLSRFSASIAEIFNPVAPARRAFLP
jgi:hypothetical protein